jgi:hypothetical protein
MAQENIEVDVNLNGNAIVNGALQNLSSAPGSPVVGQLYFDTTLGTAREWNGSAWKNLDASTITDGSIPGTAIGSITSSQVSDFTTAVEALSPSAILNQTSPQSGANFNISGVGTMAGGAMIGATNNTISSPGLVQGTDNTISGTHDLASGYNNNVSGNLSAAIGESNTSAGHQSFALGKSNTASGDRSFALGMSATANNANSFVIGDGSAPTADTASGQFVVRASNGITLYDDATGTAAATLSGGNLAITGNISAANFTGAGINNGTSLQTSASFNVDGTGEIGTTLLVGDSTNTISGVGSAAFGKYNAVTGDGVGGSVAIGRGNTVSGTQSFSTGNSNTSSGNYSFTAGEGNVAAGRDSIAMGSAATATNDNSFVLGDNSAATADSLAHQFTARFSNGFVFLDNTGSTPGMTLNTGALSVLNNISAGGNINVTGGTVNSSSIVNGASNTNTGFQVLNSGSTNVTSGTVSVALGTTANDGGFNGTFTFCDGTAPLTATAAHQFNVRASGGIKFYDDATGTPAATISGGNLAVTGNISAANLVSGATAQYDRGAIAATTSMPSTCMLGANAAFTPSKGTPVLVIVTGFYGDATYASSAALAYGGGSAPALGDAAIGTTFGTIYNPGSGNHSMTIAAIVTGLTAGTPYWFDLQVTSGGSNSNYGGLTFTIAEL